MFNLKDLKFVRSFRNIKPKLKWLMFSQVQDYKINSSYVDMICADQDKDICFDNARLESMVEEMLVKEFSPDIKNSKSFDLLVDTVVHNIKKKQLEYSDIEQDLD